MALTKVTGQVIKNTTDVTVGVLTVTNTLAVGGTVSIGGTLTYEDVTNVDAVGLITARDGIKVGSGITLSVDGDIFATGISTVKGIHVNGTQLGEDLKVGTGVTITRDGDGFFTGIVTATSFSGDGSNLTGISVDSTQIVTGNTSVQTVDTGSDGHVKINTEGSERLRIDSDGHLHTGYTSGFGADHVNILASDGGGISIAQNNAGNATSGTVLGSLSIQAYLNTVDKSNAEVKISGIAAANHTGSSAATDMVFYTKPSSTGPGSSPTERLRIDSNGRLSLGVSATGSYPTSTTARQVQAEFKGAIDTGNNKHDGSLALNCTNNNANLYIIRSQDNQTSGISLGNINFLGYDGTDYHVASQITAARDAAGGDNDMPGRLVFSTTADGAASPTERLRITSSGQLLVATTSVTGISGDGDDLVIGSIDDSTNRGITLATTGQAAIRWADDGDNAMGRVQYSNSTDKMNFYTSNAERLTILSDGKIGINDSSPSRRLEITEASDTGYVINTATVNNCLMLTNPQTGSTKNIGISFSGGYSNGEGYITMVGDGGTGGDFRFALRSGGSRTDRMTITNDSTINGDFNDTSDINLKENIASIPSSIDKVKQLRPVTFDWRESYRPNNVSGFIAQEVKKIYPDLIRGVEWTAEDPGKHYTINTMGVVAHLTKALQESIIKIEALEAEVAALKSS